MASCSINSLLASGKCFAAMPPYILSTVELDLWCDISGGIVPPASGPSLWNPEANSGISDPDLGPIQNPEA